jgi:RNA polymerase sigma factor (sigma-70 family)
MAPCRSHPVSVRDDRPEAGPSPPVRAASHLSREISRGNSAALAEFYESRFEALLVLARTFTGRDESFCLDVVQETMLRVARRMKPMPTEADLDRWTRTVLRSAATDLLRREARRARREARAGLATPRVAAQITIRGDAGGSVPSLRAALGTLSPGDALLLKLRFHDGATLDQAGHALDTTGDAAHGRIRRSLDRLRSMLSEAAL